MNALVKSQLQPMVRTPKRIACHIDQHTGDSRIIRLWFHNRGDKSVPSELRHAALIPTGVTPTPTLALTPNLTTYEIPSDSELSDVEVSVGMISLEGGLEIGVLVAVFTVTLSDGVSSIIVHICAHFDRP